MKILVTHFSPDLDAIGSVWVIKRFLPGWQHAEVEFVHPGDRSDRVKRSQDFEKNVIVTFGEDEIMHVDTGLGPLDHHQSADDSVSAASKAWDYVKQELAATGKNVTDVHEKAISRMMQVIVANDHFKEIELFDIANDFYDFSFFGLLEGIKFEKQNQDSFYIEFGMQCLDALLHTFTNKMWVEEELAEKGKKFVVKDGKGIGVETLNHALIKMAQRKGYVLVVRKDPRNGFAAIAVKPGAAIDLTLAHEQLKKMDPDATWYLHISKKMLLNGAQRNPHTKPTSLSLSAIIGALENLYNK